MGREHSPRDTTFGCCDWGPENNSSTQQPIPLELPSNINMQTNLYFPAPQNRNLVLEMNGSCFWFLFLCAHFLRQCLLVKLKFASSVWQSSCLSLRNIIITNMKLLQPAILFSETRFWYVSNPECKDLPALASQMFVLPCLVSKTVSDWTVGCLWRSSWLSTFVMQR